MIKKCNSCKKLIKSKQNIKFCSKKCHSDWIGSKEGREKQSRLAIKKGFGKWMAYKFGPETNNYTGGRHYTGTYIRVLRRDHPFCDSKGYVYEHRLLMEDKLNRYLHPYEVVHHINGVKTDNRIDNLSLFEGQSHHARHHFTKKG